MKYRYSSIKAFGFFCITIIGIVTMSTIKVMAQTNMSNCTIWHSKVDPNIEIAPSEIVRSQEREAGTYVITPSSPFKDISDADILFGIQCLLALKGSIRESNIAGATRPDTSQIFESATVEVAALYYISYLFTKDWGHAGAAVLVDERGAWNTDESIQKAYNAYQAWFEKVEKLGLKEARDDKLDPLFGTGINWY